MRHKLFFLFLLGSIIIIDLASTAPGSYEGDEDLDSLINEFLTETKELSNPQVSKPSTEEENTIPLNAQTKFLKHSKCNCTKFFMCDVEEDTEDRMGKEESESGESIEGADISVINIRLNVPAGACPHYLDICCEKIKQQSSVLTSPSKSTPKERMCGKRNVGGVGFRIIDGNDGEAQYGEFPWMTAITEILPPRYPDDKPTKAFVCGASLIHPRAILTAAHCVQNKTASSLKARVGEWDTQTTNELYPHQDVNVAKIIVHEGYYLKKLRNDVAILILEKDVEIGSHISPVCLPPIGINLDGARCLASGWGKNEYGQEGLYQAILKRVDLPIVPRDRCQKSLQDAKLGNRFRLHDSFVCAGGEAGEDTCKGDGGSPLVCQMPGSTHYVQYGIVSWGLGCGTRIPAVYVNVPMFTNWIEEKLSEAGLDKKYLES